MFTARMVTNSDMPTTPSKWLYIHYTLQVEMPGDAPFNENIMGRQHSEGALQYSW